MTKEEKTIYVFALRYALPRHSCALSCVLEMLIPRLGEFERWELEDMLRDCGFYYPDTNFGGDTCDRPLVDKFAERLRQELERRERKNESNN